MSFPFTSSSFAAFVVRCTLVTPVYPPQQPCRLLALVGHFWRLLPRRRQHTSATSPDLLNRFCTSTAILPYCHCICCCPSYHWLCLFTSNASCHGKQTLQFLHCLSAEQLRSKKLSLHRHCAATLSSDSSRCLALLHCCASAHGAQPPLKDIHALQPALRKTLLAMDTYSNYSRGTPDAAPLSRVSTRDRDEYRSADQYRERRR